MAGKTKSRYQLNMERTLLAIQNALGKVPAARPHPVWWRRWLGQTYRDPQERIDAAETFIAALRREMRA